LLRGTMTTFTYIDMYLNLYELTPAGAVVSLFSYQDSGVEASGQIVTRAINFVGSFVLSDAANRFSLAGIATSGGFTQSFNNLAVYAWYY